MIGCGRHGQTSETSRTRDHWGTRFSRRRKARWQLARAADPEDAEPEEIIVTSPAARGEIFSEGEESSSQLVPTREPIDPVRSSPPQQRKMGVALARAAWRRGADVTLIAGHVDIRYRSRFRRLKAGNGAGMSGRWPKRFSRPRMSSSWPTAPADFRPVSECRKRSRSSAAAGHRRSSSSKRGHPEGDQTQAQEKERHCRLCARDTRRYQAKRERSSSRRIWTSCDMQIAPDFTIAHVITVTHWYRDLGHGCRRSFDLSFSLALLDTVVGLERKATMTLFFLRLGLVALQDVLGCSSSIFGAPPPRSFLSLRHFRDGPETGWSCGH